MSLSKENKKARRYIRSLVEQADWMGHVACHPIKVVFLSAEKMEDCFATTELKGKGNKKYIEIAFDEEYLNSPHGRDLCRVNMVHELAHAFTWVSDLEVEESRTSKYGVHGPDFGIVYAQLWTDLIEGRDD